MPELPEVQTVVNGLIKEQIIGKKIIKVELFYQKSIAEPHPSHFCHQIVGQEITAIERRGKYIVITIDSLTLLIHLKMSGRLLLEKRDFPPSKHERVRFLLEDGRILRFIDPRKFGRLYLLSDPLQRLNLLGVDPIFSDFTLSHFIALLNRKMKIKSLLLNQAIISGIGNIYADEILWEAKIHPETLAKDLSYQEREALYRAILFVLRFAIANQGTSLGKGSSNFQGLTGERGKHIGHLRVYHKTGTPCFRCGTPIMRIVIQGRSTHLCDKCQPKT